MRLTVIDPTIPNSPPCELEADFEGSTLVLGRTLRKGVRVTPATIEDTQALIAHLEASLALRDMPEPGEKRRPKPGETEWASEHRGTY